MNDDQLHDLDQRAAAAAADLHERAAARPVPTFDGARVPTLAAPTPIDHGRRVTPRRVMAVAAAVVLLAGGGWALASTRDHRDQGPADEHTDTTDLPRPLMADPPPDGWTLMGVGDLEPPTSEQMGGTPVELYGPSATEPGFGILYERQYPLDEVSGGEAVDVPGKEGVRAFDGLGLGPRALLVPSDVGAVLITSPTLTRAQLVDVAATIEVADGKARFDEATLPEGWHRLGQERDYTAISSPIGALRGTTGIGSITSYGSPRTEASFVSVLSAPGDELSVHAPAMFVEELEPIVVRGHDGTIGRYARDRGFPAENWVLSWEEHPGNVVRVFGSSAERDTVLAFAASLRSVPQGEWDELVERTMLGEFAGRTDPEDDDSRTTFAEIGRGRFADGTAWRLEAGTLDGEDRASTVELHVALREDSDSEITGSSGYGVGGSFGGRVILASETTTIGSRHFAGGLLATGAAGVEARGSSGRSLGRAELVTADGVSGFAIEVPEGAVRLVAVDASGAVLDEISLDGDGQDEPVKEIPSTPTTVLGD